MSDKIVEAKSSPKIRPPILAGQEMGSMALSMLSRTVCCRLKHVKDERTVKCAGAREVIQANSDLPDCAALLQNLVDPHH